MSAEPAGYRAFISYSHRDSHMAGWLHRRMESYSLPRTLRKQEPGEESAARYRLRPVFRDREELASSASLSASIQQALDASEALVVICTPAAATSRWVNEEIRYFRERHPQRPVLAFVAGGDPGADPRRDPEHAAIPLYLLLADITQADGPLSEPLAADGRREGDGRQAAFLKLAAGLLGVPYDRLRQRELHRRQKRWAMAGSASLVLAAVFAAMAWRATVARNDARAARAQAELELISERQTRDFLLSVFQLADPGEARGEKVTVREVLESAVARIDSTDFARPVIRSRFLATMGQAYSSLGMNRRSVELLRQSLNSLPQDEMTEETWTQRIDSQLELADVFFDMGEYDAALDTLDSATSGEAGSHLGPMQIVQASNIRGDVLSYLERDEEAMAAYEQALQELDRASPTREEEASSRSRSLGGVAVLQHFAGEYDEALHNYAEVVNILLPVYGKRHPDTIWAMVSWGSAAYSAGDVETAREAWTQSVQLAREVLGETHPEVGTIKNNLGRLLFETGDYAQAETLLREGLLIDRTHRSEGFDDLAFTLNNLALTRMAQGDNQEARTLLEEALKIAEASRHRMLGPILVGLADINCQAGDTGTGMELAQRSVVVTEAEYGEDDWRSQRALLTAAYCKHLAGQATNLKLLNQARDALHERWGPESYFSRRADEQLENMGG